MDQGHPNQPKVTFPIQGRSRAGKHNKPLDFEGAVPLINTNLDKVDEGPLPKKPRLGEPPYGYIQALKHPQDLQNWNSKQNQLAGAGTEAGTVCHSMHTVLEDMNLIVNEAKLVNAANKRMLQSQGILSSAELPSSTSGKALQTKDRVMKMANTGKGTSDVKLTPEKLGQKRKCDSEFGNVDQLQDHSRVRRSARRLIYEDVDDTELMDFNDQ